MAGIRCGGLLVAALSGCAMGGNEISAGEAEAAATTETKVELKLVVEPADIAKARYRFGLSNAGSEVRNIWFYDTPWLELYDAGVVMRARQVDGDEDDSTIKLRPFEANDLDAKYLALDDAKCEIDRGLARSTSSCSLSAEPAEGEIAAVGAEENGVDTLFSSEQEEMYWTYGPFIDLSELVPLGPIFARVWKLETDDLPSKATVELWYMPDGSEVLELSIKVGASTADTAMTDLQGFVSGRGVRLATEQDSKTQSALEQLVDVWWWWL